MSKTQSISKFRNFPFQIQREKTTTLCGVLFSSAEWVYMIAQNHRIQEVKVTALFALVGIGSTYNPSSLSANTVIMSTSSSFLQVFLSLRGRKRLCLYLLAYWGRVTDEEGTLKTPIPKCRHYWSICLGWWSNFVGSESPAEYGLQHNSTPPPPLPQPHTVCIYCTFILGRGEGRGQREGRGATVTT